MRKYKLREITSYSQEGREMHNIYGITIPKKIAVFFKDCFFTIHKSGSCIIMTSGCCHKITKEEIEKYDFTQDVMR